MLYNEMRKDYILNRWVVIATERGMRPSDFTKQKENNSKGGICPLCPGNEQMTPPAVLVYLGQNEEVKKVADKKGFRHKNWLIRNIPNLYPAFSPPKLEDEEKQMMKSSRFGLAVGHHEVLIESPEHNGHPSETKVAQLVHVINAYIDRLRYFRTKSYVKHVSIFRNYGSKAGASLSHPHSQIIAMPFIPRIPKAEFEVSKDFYEKRKRCIFCDILEKEKIGPRLILQNQEFLVFAPYASVHPLEFWLIPKRHSPSILNISNKEVHSLAETLKKSMKTLRRLANGPPYNFGFHMRLDENCAYFHWHLEVCPKLAIWGGFEKSNGMYINTIMPEIAAEEMRKIISA